MNIFDHMKKNNSRELLFLEEASISLKAIIAIDSIVLGPANASAKFLNYKNEDEAITDALDVAYYNSLKASLLRRSLGGGSIILWGDPDVKNEMYFRALGLFLNRWNGKMYMSKGTGISYEDLKNVKKESKYVLGLEENLGGHGKISISRASGMIWGLKAAAKHSLKTNSLEGLKIVVQGIGELGSELVKFLIEEKANIIITDKIYDKIKVVQDSVNDIKIVQPSEVYKEKCDIFCSCATDKIINLHRAEQLNCKILTGSTNEILTDSKTEHFISGKKINYIPGYIINSGDIIQLANELEGYGKEKIIQEMSDIYYNTLDLLHEAEKQSDSIRKISIKRAADYTKQVSAIKMLK